MPSSLAITNDLLAAANRISAAKQRVAPFVLRTLRCGPGTRRAAIDGADLVIVPGLGVATETELNAHLVSPDARRAVEILRRAFDGGAAVAASCTSTFLLAEAGLLAGRRATTTWWLSPAFRRRYPDVDLVADRIVVADWPVVTGGAAMAQMDVMLAIVAKFGGPGLSETCARYLLLDERRSQASFMAIAQLAVQDTRIARAESWVRRNIARAFTIEDVAGAVALTPRTFARRLAATCGLSPIRFVQRVRLEMAANLLKTTRLSVDEVARRVGYTEPSTLRRLVRRETKRSLKEMRNV